MPHLRQINCICCEAEELITEIHAWKCLSVHLSQNQNINRISEEEHMLLHSKLLNTWMFIWQIGWNNMLINLLIAIKIYEWQRLMKQMDESH